MLLARRISVPHDFSSTALYRALRAINPSPYMYHLVLDGVELVGSSPELLVRMQDGRVTVRPIAGTRPRGATPDADAAMAAELLADAALLADYEAWSQKHLCNEHLDFYRSVEHWKLRPGGRTEGMSQSSKVSIVSAMTIFANG